MKIALVAVGKTETADWQDAVLDYSKRVGRYATFEFEAVTEERLARALDRYDRVFLLDERGKELRSVDFADFIDKQMGSGVRSVAFAIGGPFGFSEEVRALADGSLSLSKMTFPHDLARVVFLEQLYRAFTILRNEKYHHE